MFEHNVKYNSKVQKELKVLSKAGDMTTDFFKREFITVIREYSSQGTHIGSLVTCQLIKYSIEVLLDFFF